MNLIFEWLWFRVLQWQVHAEVRESGDQETLLQGLLRVLCQMQLCAFWNIWQQIGEPLLQRPAQFQSHFQVSLRNSIFILVLNIDVYVVSLHGYMYFRFLPI